MERTHEPCVPTCLSWLYWYAKWLRWKAARVHVGTHGSCVRSKRWVHSLQQPCYLLSNPLRGRTDLCISTYIPNGADARANAYWLTFPMERTHEPCVPTCLLLTNHLNNKTNPKGQSSMFKGQSQGPYMPIMGVLQCSNIKVQSLMLILSRP